MSKRVRSSDVANGSVEAVEPSPKRSRPTAAENKNDALALLLENADGLIDCLQRLKAEKSKRDDQGKSFKIRNVEEATKADLSSLSAKLAPALQLLGSEGGESGEAAKQTRAEEPTGTKEEPSLRIPPYSSVTKWTSATISKTYPSLPAVLDPALEKAALTHSGKTGRPGELDYERLEWIGDVYLELIATLFVYQTFPNLPPGKSSQYRELLVRNITLSEFSLHYGLDKRANFPEEFGLGGRVGGTTVSGTKRIKALGDIFEAYVGAIILSDDKDGIRRASDWLKVLWGSTLARQIREYESRHDTTISPKTALEQAIGVKGIKIEYRDLPDKGKKERDTNLPLFTVGCFLNGWGETDKQLGYGSATGKKDAGQKAAQMALDNKKLIKKYAEKKKLFDAARATQAAQAEKAV